MKKLFTLLFIPLFLMALHASDRPVVVLETTQGNVELELYHDVAPLAVENFVTHIKNGYYDGIIFHRVIKRFMIQGGDPSGTGMGGQSIWGKPFKDEFKPGYAFDEPGILAMANAGPNTNGSQFFITTVPTPHLNGYHTIFGKVIGGMETVYAIENVATTGYADGNMPLERQQIIKAYLK